MPVWRYLRGRFGDARLAARIALHLIRPHEITVVPTPLSGDHVHSLVSHTHIWDRCRWNGQVWYARCIAYEWCTARIAC